MPGIFSIQPCEAFKKALLWVDGIDDEDIKSIANHIIETINRAGTIYFELIYGAANLG